MAVAYYSDSDALAFFQSDLPNVKEGVATHSQPS